MEDFDDDGEPGPVIAPRRQKCINRKTKLHIVFDEKARRDFLTGFHKRKLQRKKAAQEELKSQLKAEKKRIKLESKNEYKKLVHSYKPIPELEKQFAKEFKVADAKVSVLELDTDLLAETNFLIGRNKGKPKEAEVPEEVEDEVEELPGMEVKTKKQVKKMIKDNAKVMVQQSKAFQTLNRIQKQKQKKKASKEKERKMKIKAKIQKKKRGRNRNGP